MVLLYKSVFVEASQGEEVSFGLLGKSAAAAPKSVVVKTLLQP